MGPDNQKFYFGRMIVDWIRDLEIKEFLMEK